MAAERRTQKTVRNNRGVTLHLRLKGRAGEKPFRVELHPRGKRGDWVTVPAACTADPQFEEFVSMGLVEIIPLKEARAITYAPIPRVGLEGIKRMPAMKDRENSKVVGYLTPETTEMVRDRPTAPTIADAAPDQETQRLIDSGVMPPIPRIVKNKR